MAAASIFTGCGASAYRAVTSSSSETLPNPQPIPAGAITSATMTVSDRSVGSFGKGFVGLAYEKASLCQPLFGDGGGDLIGLFSRLGTGVLRVGGESVDRCVWTQEGEGQTKGQIAPADVDALAYFLKQTGWTCIYGINLGGSATGATSPQLAAAEVAYVARAFGASLVGIEIGSECESYGDAGSYYPFDWTVEKFETLWMEYRDAIVAVTPTAPLVGPAASSEVAGWTIPFGEFVTKQRMSLLTQHYYRGQGSAATATVQDLVLPDDALSDELALLKDGAQSMGVPFRMAGCGSYGDGGTQGVSDAYASSLWALDMIFQCALSGATGINFRSGGGQGYDTVIEDSGGTVGGPRPIFYGLMTAAMIGVGDLLATEVATGGLNVTGYAVKGSDGGFTLIVVNKDSSQSLDLSVKLPKTITTATLQLMTQSSDGASTANLSAKSGVTIQGSSVSADGSFAPKAPYAPAVTGEAVSCYVPALSAVLIRLH